MTFLDIDIGARPAARGGSFVAQGGTVDALFWNPAGIGTLRGLSFVGSQAAWLADIDVYAFGMAFGTSRFGTIGLSLVSLDNPDVRVTSFVGGERWEDQGFQDIIRQFALGFTYAKQITDLFSVGGQVKWAHEDLGTFDYVDRLSGEQTTGWQAKMDAITFDFGTLYNTGFRGLRLALSIRNFAPRSRYQLEYFDLPLSFRLGMAVNVISVIWPEADGHVLNLSMDTISPRDFSERMQLGCEYWYRQMFALRAGYKFHHDLEGFATGVGIRQDIGKVAVSMDYAYSLAGGFFQDIHRLSLSVSY
jgi:hypothetical protein